MSEKEIILNPEDTFQITLKSNEAILLMNLLHASIDECDDETSKKLLNNVFEKIGGVILATIMEKGGTK